MYFSQSFPANVSTNQLFFTLKTVTEVIGKSLLQSHRLVLMKIDRSLAGEGGRWRNI